MPQLEFITRGIPITLTQNRVFATPARRSNYFITPAASTIECSNDQTTWVAQTVSAQGTFTAEGLFLRLTSAGPAIVRAVAA
jgi:hypothetical protein